MRLIDEVKFLKKNLPRIKNLTVETGLMSGPVDSAYELVKYMALARNIFDKIDLCKNDKFSITKEELENKAQNSEEKIEIKKIFNQIIHGAYISKSDGNLRVRNDWGYEYIISAEEFMNVLDSLCLKDHEVAFVVCKILRYRIQKSYDMYVKEGYSDRYVEVITNQIILDHLFWLVCSYCSTGDLAREVVANFFREQIDNKVLPSFSVSGAKLGGDFIASDYLAFELDGYWEEKNNKVNEKRVINLYDLLSLVEKYAERVSGNLIR